jgi:hypothetical protein
MVIDDTTTVADIDEALGHLRQSRLHASEVVRLELEPRIDALLDARLALEHP